MNKSAFNPDWQQENISSKVVAGLERISGAFKSLLWEKAMRVGLSPIQIQILIFIAFHNEKLCNVSHLAKEFNVTKPTISDAIKALYAKKMVKKEFSATDNRSYTIGLSPLGREMVSKTSDFADPMKTQIDGLNQKELESFFNTVGKLVYKLKADRILEVQRTCYGCGFHQKTGTTHYCTLLDKRFSDKDIRLDCSVYQEKV